MNGGFRVAVVAAAYLTLSFTGCDGGGESASPSTTPAAPPAAPPPPPPPPEPTTWIGFADPARASLFEGGRFRAVVQVSGALLRSPLVLSVEQSGPAGQVLTPDTVEIGAYAHGAVEIVGISDRRTELPTEFGITLVPPPEGLPPEVALAAESANLNVTLIDGDHRPGCERLELSATREDFDFDGVFSTARVTLEGPRNVGLRISEPYWEERLEDGDEPPELPIDLSDVPPVTLAIPRGLLYQGLADGGHRQRISLSWYNDLRLAAVAPGCAPTTLRCPVRTILTHGCRP